MRDRLLAGLALLGFLLICLAAVASRRPSHAVAPVSFGSPANRRSSDAPMRNDLTATPPKPFQLHIPHWLIQDLYYLAYAIVFGVLLFIIIKLVPYLSVEQRRRRRARQLAPATEEVEEFDEQTQDRLAQAFSDALSGFDLADANRAIVACWIRLEQIAEGVGFARQRWETSTELITRWLSRASLPSEPLHHLAELYREARYSGRPMSKDQIESARATLTQLRIAFQPSATRDSGSDGTAERHG